MKNFFIILFCLFLFPHFVFADVNCIYGSPVDLGGGDFQYSSSSCFGSLEMSDLGQYYLNSLFVFLAFVLMFLIILVFLIFKK